jgi:hypothetical protein
MKMRKQSYYFGVVEKRRTGEHSNDKRTFFGAERQPACEGGWIEDEISSQRLRSQGVFFSIV